MSDIEEVGAFIERQGLTCRHCGGEWTSPSAAAFCCEDEDDGRGRE